MGALACVYLTNSVLRQEVKLLMQLLVQSLRSDYIGWCTRTYTFVHCSTVYIGITLMELECIHGNLPYTPLRYEHVAKHGMSIPGTPVISRARS